METVLITGVSGFLGKGLAKQMSKKYNVIGMSRRDPGEDCMTFVKGDFALFEDLRQLDDYKIDAVVHLAAVTGGCSERDAVMVNCEGTRCLMRYLIDHGCKKFVFASSIALIGIQNIEFRPQQLPIPDEHPCLDRDGYGISKFLMEEITKYYQRQNPDIDVINLRLAAIQPEDSPAPLREVCPNSDWSLAQLTGMLESDAINVFATAAESPMKPGMRIMNATAPVAWANVPTAEILREWWANDVDLCYYEDRANTYAGAYDVSLIKDELGFVATNTVEYVAKQR